MTERNNKDYLISINFKKWMKSFKTDGEKSNENKLIVEIRIL